MSTRRARYSMVLVLAMGCRLDATAPLEAGNEPARDVDARAGSDASVVALIPALAPDTTTAWPGWQVPVDVLANDTVGTGAQLKLASAISGTSATTIYHNKVLVTPSGTLGVDTTVVTLTDGSAFATEPLVVSTMPTPPATDAGITTSVQVGAQRRITLTVTERVYGPNDLQAATFTLDPLPSTVSFPARYGDRCVSTPSNGAYCYRGNNIGPIPAGGVRQFQLLFIASAPVTFTFKAHYTTVSADPVTSNNTLAKTVVVP